MNLSTMALLLLGFYVLSGGSQQKKSQQQPNPPFNFSEFLSADTKDILSCMNTLSSSDCSQEDKTSALFRVMSNPAVMNIAESFLGRSKQNDDTQIKRPEDCDKKHQNDEGYQFETPSASSQEFFHQIDNIADAEVKHKLYWFYDNWYVKK